MEPLVSIIVPMYNSEKYLGRCIDSILSQTYKNIEIIIVNDGSTDESMNIIEAYQDNRIKVFNKKNEGVSIARNYGIDKSIGDYLLFIDSDDYASENIVGKLVSGIDAENAFIFCNNFEVWDKKVETRTVFNEVDSISKEVVIKEIASGRAGLVCSKLISRKVVADNKIYFDENLKIGEDQLFFLQVSKYCNAFKHINEALYYYDRTNEDSATRKYQENLLEDFMYLYKRTEEFFDFNNLNSQEYKRILGNKLLAILWTCSNNEVNHLKDTTLKLCKIEITKILEKTSREIKYPYEKNRLNSKLDKLIKKKSKEQAALNLIAIIKLLNLKMKVRNKIRYES